MEKEFLRKEMKEKRRSLSREQIQAASHIICTRLFHENEYKNAKSICIYMNSFGEVETSEIIEDCRKNNKDILFPVTNMKNHTIRLCRDCGVFIKGAYGILEPEKKEYVPFSVPELIIVPGIAFDRDKNRLGFGAGYYDRMLVQTNAVSLGMCYDFQLVDKINCQPHDIKMDMVLTDKQIIV